MAKLIELSEEEKINVLDPKKRRRMDSEETQEDEDPEPQPVEEEEDEETYDEFEDEEQQFEEAVDEEEEANEVVEDEKSTETVKIDEEGEEDEEDESKEENKRKFYLTDLELFDCTVCLQRLNIPIVYLCENEHMLCSGCFSSSSTCRICVPASSYKRCRILEKILKSIGESCENLKYGCKRPVHYTMKLDHEKYCKFGPCSCPIQGCDFLAPSMQLSAHLSINHSGSFSRFSFDHLYSISFSNDERFCVLQEMNSGDMFLIQNAKHDLGIMISVNQIGPPSFRSQFFLDLQAKDGKQNSLRFKGEIKSVQSVFDESPTGDFLLVPSRYFEGSEGFVFQLRISHCRS